MAAETPRLVSDAGIEFALKEGLVTIGRPDRQSGWEPTIDLSSVDHNRRSSRRHAEIHVAGNTVTLRDLASANKTFLNGQPLEPNKDYPLAEGDTITFGGEAKLRIEGLASGAPGLRCPKCDEAVTPDMAICASCGANLTSSTMTIELAPKHPCFRCGRPTRGEELCGECGAAVAEADQELLTLSGLKRKR
ncbi:MAG: FHA domain-containing protein [Chloroflexota bacterium]|nr:FHA domain-containing protein [Chloroflexota bacterium]